MCKIKVEIKKVNLKSGDSAIAAYTPYSTDFVSEAKKLNGKWDGAAKAWVFDERDGEKVREICRKVYGTDGATLDVELVTVRLCLDKIGTSYDKLELFGRSICRRQSRDSAVRLDGSVIIVEGGFPETGGSVKNPSLSTRTGTILEVRDVPKSIIKPEDFQEGAIEILENDKKVNIQALKDEAVAIRKRLAEILEILEREGERV